MEEPESFCQMLRAKSHGYVSEGSVQKERTTLNSLKLNWDHAPGQDLGRMILLAEMSPTCDCYLYCHW
jgi:hypothetical protein